MNGRARPVLVAGARTPIGKHRGALACVSALDLGASAVRAALERSGGMEPDYVVLGNVLQAGNGQNPGRAAALRGGVRREVAGLTLNDVCLSSMTAVGLAAHLVAAGERQAILVGGFDSMTQAPHAVRLRDAPPSGHTRLVDLMVHDGLWCSIDDVGMGELSDRQNARLGIGRVEQDEYALRSHRLAAEAADSGRLDEQIVPFTLPGGDVTHDEGIRRDSSLEALALLEPAFLAGGSITAGNSSQLSDAAAAGLVATCDRAQAAGVEPLATIEGTSVVAGSDSTLHLRPAEAARRLLDQTRMTPADVDIWEINEAFAGVVLASIDALGIDLNRVNPNGGAIAVGHPLAASGFRLLLTLAGELRRRGGGVGVAAMCGGGGQGAAVLLRTL